MAIPPEFFVYPKAITVAVTITSTAQLLSALVASALAGYQLQPERVMGYIVMGKVAAGTDRLAIYAGWDTAQMNLHYIAGVPDDTPVLGDRYVKRVGGADVPAVVLVGFTE